MLITRTITKITITGFRAENTLKRHREFCSTIKAQLTVMPMKTAEKDETVEYFNSYGKTVSTPYLDR